MPDPVTGIVGGLSLFQGSSQRRAADRATDAQVQGQQAAIAEQQAAREEFRRLSEPFLQAGQAGINPLLELLGIGQGGGQPQGLAEINPLVDFLRNQGFEQIQESAAGRGFTGGTLNELTQFNTDLASTIVPQLQQQKFNQLFNLVGLGANTATGVGTAGMQSAMNIGNAFGNIGAAQAQGAINRSNAFGNTLSDLAFIGGRAFQPSAGGFTDGLGGFNFLGGSAGRGTFG